MSLRLFAFAGWITSAASFGSFPAFSPDSRVPVKGQSAGNDNKDTDCPAANVVKACKLNKLLKLGCEQWPNMINTCYHMLWRQPSEIGPFDSQQDCLDLGEDNGLAMIGGGATGGTACNKYDEELTFGCSSQAYNWVDELCYEGLNFYEQIALGEIDQSSYPVYDGCNFSAPLPAEDGKSIIDLINEGNLMTNVIEASGLGFPRNYWAVDLCAAGESASCAGEPVTNIEGATECEDIPVNEVPADCPARTYYEVVDAATDERKYCSRVLTGRDQVCMATSTEVCGAPSPPPLSPAPLSPPAPPPSVPAPPGPCAALDATGRGKIAVGKDENGHSINNNCNKFALYKNKQPGKDPRDRTIANQNAKYLDRCVEGYLYYEDTGMYHNCWVNNNGNCARSNKQSDMTSPADC